MSNDDGMYGGLSLSSLKGFFYISCHLIIKRIMPPWYFDKEVIGDTLTKITDIN